MHKEDPARAHSKQTCFTNEGDRPQEKRKPTHTLTLDFSLQSCEERSSIIFKPPSLWYLVMAVLAKLIVHVSITAPPCICFNGILTVIKPWNLWNTGDFWWGRWGRSTWQRDMGCSQALPNMSAWLFWCSKHNALPALCRLTVTGSRTCLELDSIIS